MKKIFAIFMIAVVLLASVCIVNAADFTPSVTAKDAPEVVANDDGSVGTVKDASGNVVATVTQEQVSVVSYANRTEDSTAASKLNTAYEDLTSGKVQDELKQQLTSYAASVDSEYTADNMVVSDLFYLDVEDTVKNSLDGSNYLEVTFETGIAAGEKAPAVLYACDGTNWEMVDPANVKNNGDGTITVKFSTLCPIAFMSASASAAPAPGPQPAPQTVVSIPGLIILILVSALVGAGIVVLIFLIKKLRAA